MRLEPSSYFQSLFQISIGKCLTCLYYWELLYKPCFVLKNARKVLLMPQFSLDTNTTNQCVQSSFPSYEWCIFAKLVQGIISIQYRQWRKNWASNQRPFIRCYFKEESVKEHVKLRNLIIIILELGLGQWKARNVWVNCMIITTIAKMSPQCMGKLYENYNYCQLNDSTVLEYKLKCSGLCIDKKGLMAEI